MDKILMTKSDFDYIFEWKERHKDLVRRYVSPFKAIEIRVDATKDGGTLIYAKCINEGNILKFNITLDKNPIGNFKLSKSINGTCSLLKDNLKYAAENKDSFIQDILGLYAMTMAFITFGDDVSPDISENECETIVKNMKRAVSKSSKGSTTHNSNNITYIFTKHKNKLDLAAKGSHMSPRGIFGVRGHFRHYKNGNVIWIEPYKKGLPNNKRKNKNYKIQTA